MYNSLRNQVKALHPSHTRGTWVVFLKQNETEESFLQSERYKRMKEQGGGIVIFPSWYEGI